MKKSKFHNGVINWGYSPLLALYCGKISRRLLTIDVVR